MLSKVPTHTLKEWREIWRALNAREAALRDRAESVPVDVRSAFSNREAVIESHRHGSHLAPKPRVWRQG